MATTIMWPGVRMNTPLVLDGFEAQREVRNVFNPVLGGGVVAVPFPAGPRHGTITAVYLQQWQALELDSMLQQTTPLVLQDSDAALNMTFLADGSIRVYSADDTIITTDGEEVLPWFVEFGYQEVTI